MSDKYDEYITIRRTGEKELSLDCRVKMEALEQSIIMLFRELENIDSMRALAVLGCLIGIAEEKEA